LGLSRSTASGIAGGLLAQSEASARVPLSQNVQVEADGKQQRQQQWTSGGAEVVIVDGATGVCSGEVVSCEVNRFEVVCCVVVTSAVVAYSIDVVSASVVLVVVISNVVVSTFLFVLSPIVVVVGSEE